MIRVSIVPSILLYHSYRIYVSVKIQSWYSQVSKFPFLGFQFAFVKMWHGLVRKWHITLQFEDWLIDLIGFLFDVLPHIYLDIFHLQPGYLDRTSEQSFSARKDLHVAVNIPTCLSLVHVYTGKYCLGLTPLKGLGRENNKRPSRFGITWSRDRHFYQFQHKFHTV